MKFKHFSLRIDEDLLRELRRAAKEDGRSVKKELLWLIRQNIEEFEAEHGEILLPEQE